MTAAGLVRLCLIAFAIAAALLALDSLKDALEEAFQTYGPAVWRLATSLVMAAVLAGAAVMALRAPHRLIRPFLPEDSTVDFGRDYARWKTLMLMLSGGLVALPALDHLVFALTDGRALDTAQALIELSLAIVLVVGPGVCGRLMLRFVAHR
ncbi:MAG: hypothetical protein JF571_06100 [Asticcacaulis sp.]|nr:hypothetical protein [Asticcacaulis sp.]